MYSSLIVFHTVHHVGKYQESNIYLQFHFHCAAFLHKPNLYWTSLLWKLFSKLLQRCKYNWRQPTLRYYNSLIVHDLCVMKRNVSASWSQAGKITISDGNLLWYSHSDLFCLCHSTLMGTFNCNCNAALMKTRKTILKQRCEVNLWYSC